MCDLHDGPSTAAGIITGLLILGAGFAAFAGLLRLIVWVHS